MQQTTSWGLHLLLDIAGCNDNITREQSIRDFVRELVERIDMVAYGEPVIQHFATHSYDAAGYSLVQLIETSAITGHFSDHNRDAYLDVFSCKPFEPEQVIEVVEKYFAPHSIHSLFVPREAKQQARAPFKKVK